MGREKRARGLQRIEESETKVSLSPSASVLPPHLSVSLSLPPSISPHERGGDDDGGTLEFARSLRARASERRAPAAGQIELLGGGAGAMSSLSRELVFLILQFLDEEKFKETVHKSVPCRRLSPPLPARGLFFFSLSVGGRLGSRSQPLGICFGAL